MGAFSYQLFCSFVAENWKYGWMGQFMWGVFSQYLQIPPSKIIAMTGANFSGDTNPKNASSVYKGASSFTRCVWEVRLGHAVTLLSPALCRGFAGFPAIDAEDRARARRGAAGYLRRRFLGDGGAQGHLHLHDHHRGGQVPARHHRQAHDRGQHVQVHLRLRRVQVSLPFKQKKNIKYNTAAYKTCSAPYIMYIQYNAAGYKHAAAR